MAAPPARGERARGAAVDHAEAVVRLPAWGDKLPLSQGGRSWVTSARSRAYYAMGGGWKWPGWRAATGPQGGPGSPPAGTPLG
jgi:hypothetical protein